MWAVATLTVLTGLIVFILCVPLDIAFRVDTHGKPKLRMTLTWFFGLVSKEMIKEKKSEPKEKMAEVKRLAEKKRKRVGVILKMLRTKGLARRFLRLLKDVLSCSEITDFIVDLKVGLGDPAETGLLFGLVGPVTLFVRRSSRRQIIVQPVFDGEPVFECYSYVGVRLWPIRLVFPSARFVLSLGALKAVKVVLSSKWKRKK